jgi:hypothetical protein
MPEEKETTLDLAYQISKEYFASSIQRFDAIDNKIQNLFTFVVGVFALAPAVIKSDAKAELTIHFWLGMGLLLIAGLISIYARLHGKLNILNPKIIGDKSLGLEPDAFKKSVIETAGKAYQNNSTVIERKHQLNVLSMFVFGVALVFLVYWILQYALHQPLTIVAPAFIGFITL